MTDPVPSARLERAGGDWTLTLAGPWRLDELPRLAAQLDALGAKPDAGLHVHGEALAELDTAGAMLLCRQMRDWGLAPDAIVWHGFSGRHVAMLELVRQGTLQAPASVAPESGWLHGLGRLAAVAWRHGLAMVSFVGQLGLAALEWLRHPGRIRMRELVVQIEAVGITGLPIVASMAFMIGIVFTYLLGVQVEKYGANIFIVDGVSLAVTRELAPLLTALLVAGRSGAAFTAQIGAMKVTEEIDALRTLGLSPMQVLVLPRLLAIVVCLPLLTFFADVMGILGAALVSAQQLDITFYTFTARLRDVLPLYTVLMGLAKTPLFAMAIAILACQNGFSVTRDARSVGEHTTATVVRCLVAVMLIDALFSIAFPQIRP